MSAAASVAPVPSGPSDRAGATASSREVRQHYDRRGTALAADAIPLRVCIACSRDARGPPHAGESPD